MKNFLFVCFMASPCIAFSQSYDDVAVIVNDNSPVSLNIGNAFQTLRGIPSNNIIHINVTTAENIDTLEFADLRQQVEQHLIAHNLVDQINYLVTTKGVPLSVYASPLCNDNLPSSPMRCASVDAELSLILSSNYSHEIGGGANFMNPYFNKPNQHFSRAEFDMYLVTRLDGYSEADVIDMLNRSNINYPVIPQDVQYVFDINYSDAYRTGIFYEGAETSITALQNDNWNSVFVLDSVDNFYPSGQNVFGYYTASALAYTTLDSNNYSWAPNSLGVFQQCWGGWTFDRDTLNRFNLARGLHQGLVGGIAFSAYTYSSDINISALFSAYAKGFNLAESCYQGLLRSSWESIVIGDPKVSIVAQTTGLLAPTPDAPSVQVYPNPSVGQFVVDCPNAQIVSIVVWDAVGRAISANIHHTGNKSYVRLENAAVGMYILKIETDKGVFSQKIQVRE